MISDTPRVPVDADHFAARPRWVSFSKQARRTHLPQDLSIQAVSLYRMRFVSPSDLRKDWRTFGCLGPQLTHFSTALHISVTEAVGATLSYRRLVNLKLQEKARNRPAQSSYFVAIWRRGTPQRTRKLKRK